MSAASDRLRPILTRRELLARSANGFGLLALQALLADQALAGAAGAAPLSGGPLAPRPPHFAPRCRRLIFLFMSGGPSHVDLFDPKPRLTAETGGPTPFERPKLERTRTGNLLGSPWRFAKHGESGIDLSELLPCLSTQVDKLCVVRSMVADNINHNGACLQMNTGEQAFQRPSLGSWLTFGLGSENRDLPGYVVLSPAQPAQGAPLWSSAFLPATHQGTLVADLATPIRNLGAARRSAARQRLELDLLRERNARHAAARAEDPATQAALEARLDSFELAFRMQREAPAAFDLAGETSATRALYGLDDPVTGLFGRQCLLARRLVERGVRCVQAYHTQTMHRSSCQLWDQHGGLRAELANNCAATDRPIAALLHDLDARGLLDDTLVLWGGEFGRTPTAEGTDGREHHPFGFTMWLAGGGVKRGHVHGATDEYGWHAVDRPVHVHDLHATILHLMGLDHERLTFRHAGRDWRLTDVHGRVVTELLA
jgi:hypothetical protein